MHKFVEKFYLDGKKKWKKVAKLGKNGKNKAKMAFFEILRSNFSKYRIFVDMPCLLHDAGHRLVVIIAS